MSVYEERVRLELEKWKRDILKRPGYFEKTAKKLQGKVNQIIPDTVHKTITITVKGLVRTVLFGLEYVPKGLPQSGLSLEERDKMAKDLVTRYQRIAAAEGAGTGAGGILLGLADFPALLAIKMKFLFELAHIYGYDTRDYQERLFLLYVFQLAFSSQEKRNALFRIIVDWEHFIAEWPPGEEYIQKVNWEEFQQEYRDAIDFRKMLQLVPGVGAVVGAWANYGLLEDLGKTGINCFRLRILHD